MFLFSFFFFYNQAANAAAEAAAAAREAATVARTQADEAGKYLFIILFISFSVIKIIILNLLTFLFSSSLFL